MRRRRWDPVEEIVAWRDAIDRAIEEGKVLPTPPWQARSIRGKRPRVDMYATGEAVIIEVGMPGGRPEDVELSAMGQQLTIRGTIERGEDIPADAYLLRERHQGGFSRALDLPEGLLVDEVAAKLSDGLLTITIPKAEKAQTTTIKVQGAGGK